MGLSEQNINSKRCIDSLVAEKVMGWHLNTERHKLPAWIENGTGDLKVFQSDFQPSLRISDAWKVLGKFDGHILTKSKSDGFIYEILLHDGKGYDIIGESIAETAELAICLAALKAVGVEVDD